ncbi:MAG: FAD-binding protein [candidate division WOR-3 bacterium]
MKNILKDFKKILPLKRIIYDERKIAYNYDASSLYGENMLTVFPISKKEVSKILKYSNKYEIPLYIRGAGTGKSGGSIPLGGIVLCTLLMNKIREINFKERRIKVEAGVITKEIKDLLEKNNFFYPPDPQSYEISSIGGNVATNAGGPNSLKYGTTKDYVLSIEFVTIEGEILNAGKETQKFVMGYNLKDLLSSSEGTIGVITEIDLKFLPIKGKEVFYIIEEIPSFIEKIFESNLNPSKVELLNDKILIAIDENFEKSEKILKSISKNIKKLNEKEREEFERIRKEKSVSIWKEKGGKISIDICIPISKIEEFIDFSKNFGESIYIYGHLGSGNLHTNILYNPLNLKEREKIWEIREKIIDFVIRNNGTCSGEHGTGILYSKYLEKEIGKRMYEIEHNIKRIFDPKDILNRGKIFDKGKNFEKLKKIYFEEKREFAKLCNLCGLCNKICPFFQKYKREDISPRGFVYFYMMKNKGYLIDNKKYFKFCLKCKKCFNICPNNVQIEKIILDYLS